VTFIGDHESASHTFPLDAIHDEYQKKVLILLTSDEILGLDAAQLSKFKALYSPYAFTCRFPDCSTGVIGFPTAEARAQHEKAHAPPLLCTHAGCTYTLPFRSLHGLRRHVREYHTVKAVRIPKSVRASLRPSKSGAASRNGSHHSGVSATPYRTGATPDGKLSSPRVEYDPLSFAPTDPQSYYGLYGGVYQEGEPVNGDFYPDRDGLLHLNSLGESFDTSRGTIFSGLAPFSQSDTT
jgi:hypothetical protein